MVFLEPFLFIFEYLKSKIKYNEASHVEGRFYSSISGGNVM